MLWVTEAVRQLQLINPHAPAHAVRFDPLLGHLMSVAFFIARAAETFTLVIVIKLKQFQYARRIMDVSDLRDLLSEILQRLRLVE
jgi:hypothetical protein